MIMDMDALPPQEKNHHLNRPLTGREQVLFDKMKERINSLYFVKHEEYESPIAFQMEGYHEEVLKRLVKGFKRQDVIKGRQVYFTTFTIVLAFDLCLHVPGFSFAFHNMTDQDAIATVKHKLHYIVRNSPFVQKFVNIEQKALTDMGVKFTNGSSMMRARSGRSHTTSFNLITEAGWTAQEYPQKFSEIMDGMLQGSQFKIMFRETSPYGTDNQFIRSVRQSLKLEREGKIAKRDFVVMFIPWWKKPRNVALEEDLHVAEFTTDMETYFKRIEDEENTKLSLRQRVWWFLKFTRDFGYSMPHIRQEHPSTVEEALAHHAEAFIMARSLQRARDDNRVMPLVQDRYEEVYIGWDLGGNKSSTAITVCQRIPYYENAYAIIHAHEKVVGVDGIQYFFSYIREQGWSVAQHFLPHDARSKSLVAYQLTKRYDTNVARFFDHAGINNYTVIPKTDNKKAGFESSMNFINKVMICTRNADPLLMSLANVQRHWNDTAECFEDKLSEKGGNVKYNHVYDSFETLARANAAGLMVPGHNMRQEHEEEIVPYEGNFWDDPHWDGYAG